MFYKSYIDDCVSLLTHGDEELQNWMNYLNQCQPSIKFTGEVSKELSTLWFSTSFPQQEGPPVQPDP